MTRWMSQSQHICQRLANKRHSYQAHSFMKPYKAHHHHHMLVLETWEVDSRPFSSLPSFILVGFFFFKLFFQNISLGLLLFFIIRAITQFKPLLQSSLHPSARVYFSQHKCIHVTHLQGTLAPAHQIILID